MSEEEVYRETRVPADYIRALETSRLDQLPGPCFAKGFLKTYCEYLGLDPEPYLEALHNHRREPARKGLLRLDWLPGERQMPAWWRDVVTWASVCAVLLLAWVTYTVVVGPAVKEKEGQVEATVERVLVPPAADIGF